MGSEKQLGKSIAALLLFVALMLPSAIQFIHMSEGHEYIACTEQTTHLHKSVVKCEICSFHLASFIYDIAELPNLVQPKIPVNIEANFASLQYHSFKITNTQLRAPPIFS
jgi:hypothetical protein